jgi:hypothetical protein
MAAPSKPTGEFYETARRIAVSVIETADVPTALPFGNAARILWGIEPFLNELSGNIK